MKKNGNKKSYLCIPAGILFGVLCLLAATAFALALIHISDGFYALNVDLLDIPEKTGYSKNTCLDNYNAIMAFLSPFADIPFSLPDFPFSQGGAQHFYDCKPIFSWVYLLGAASLAAVIIIALCARKIGDMRFLLVSSVSTLAVPCALAAACAVNFDAAFVAFHKVFFTNDLWLFDVRVDPVLFILPEQFFMNCALFIASFWLLAALVQLFVYRRAARRGL